MNNKELEQIESTKELLEAGIVQQWTRTDLDNTDQIVGVFRCDLAVDQDRYALSIPIHPAFGMVPEVEAIAIDSDCRVRVTDLQKFGVRLEIIRTSSESAESIFVEVVIAATIVT